MFFLLLISLWTICRKLYFLLFVLVQYVAHLYGYLKEWSKNPHWSWSCCLALILPLISLPGDISGLAGTNMTKTQLQTDNIEIPTIATALLDSVAIEANLDEGKGGDAGPAETPFDNRNDAQPHTGEEEMPSRAAAAQDCGTVLVLAIKEGEQTGNPVDMMDDNRIGTQANNEGNEMLTSTTAVQDSETIDVTLEGERGFGNSAKVQDDNRSGVQSLNGKKEMPTSAAAIQDSGAVDVALQDDGNPAEMRSENRVDTQAKSEEKAMSTNGTALPDSAPLVVALEGVQQGDDSPTKVKNDNCEDVNCNTNKRHQETQTGLSTISSIADVVAHAPERETLLIIRKCNSYKVNCLSLIDGCIKTNASK